MTYWWGDPWPRANRRAPVCEDDSLRIDAPIGERCILCSEPIEEGDRGVSQPTIITGDDGQPMSGGLGPIHIECDLRNVVGNHLHVRGMCTHIGSCNEMSSLTYREEALEVWDLWQFAGDIECE